MYQIGSSPPLTRGKVPALAALRNRRGITPAYAGKRIAGTCIKESKKDHPRLRGEKESPAGHTMTVAGSPPLTRGKASVLYSIIPPPRITPAYAGKSLFLPVWDSTQRDHPRLRGEKLYCRLLYLRCRGSPPLTRGKGGILQTNGCGLRITPAYAGKSVQWFAVDRDCRDHPRLRGEKRNGGN